MARGAEPVSRYRTAGGLALAAVLTLTLGSFAMVLWRAEGLGALHPGDWAALRFTVLQAALSSVLSVSLAVPVARALARRRFFGRNLLITALGAPFILPVIVVIMGLLAVFGRVGIANAALAGLGLPAFSIYGLQGVLIAHVFLNLPLAVRLLLNGWAAIPAERFRLAASLGFTAGDIARVIEAPMLRTTLPGIVLAIFLICLTSFAVALTMGGGPAATTLELAIYQAFRLEFDLAHAASLAGLQFALSLAAALICLGALRASGFGAGLDRPVERWDADAWSLRTIDTCSLILAAMFVFLPIAMVLAAGVPQLAQLPPSVWRAAARSLAVALTSTGLALALALALALMIVELPDRLSRHVDALVMLSLTTSSLVLGTGMFLALRLLTDPVAWALPITALVNTTLALPFCLRALLPGLRDIQANYARLASSLSLDGVAHLRWLILPRLRRPLAFAAGLTAAMSMGDLGVITLFGDPGRATLPQQVYALASAYRTGQSAGAAVLLMTLSFALFWLFDRGGRHSADA